MKMSEDEIIEHVEYSLLNPCFNNGNSTIINNEDLKGLLDLYQKEKEKNNYEWMRRNCLPTNLVKKLYISKDKIREFIKENLPDDEICSCCDNYDSNGVAIKI